MKLQNNFTKNPGKFFAAILVWNLLMFSGFAFLGYKVFTADWYQIIENVGQAAKGEYHPK